MRLRANWHPLSAFIVVLAALTLCMPVMAQNSEESYVATGRGATPAEAIDQALIEILRRSSGVQISSVQLTELRSESLDVSSSSGSENITAIRERFDSSTRARVSGLLSSYEVLRQSPIGRGYEVEVRGNVPRYRVPGIDSSNRRRLAVLPFSTRMAVADFYGAVSGDELSDLLYQSMVGQFVQSRRFALLDRTSWSALGAERRLIASRETPIAEKAKLGRALGADYLVVGEILDASGAERTRTRTLTGVTESQSVSQLSVSYRIVVPATGEIKFADTIDISVETDSRKQAATRVSALNELAKRMVGFALDRIYPMQIVSVNGDGSVVLNQGGNTISPGDRLMLVEQGTAVVDPYTKEPLGRVEHQLGQIEVTRSDGKIAYARLVGEIGKPLRVGMLARRDNALYGAGGGADVPPPSARTEGVRLPFDR